ncbi:TPA: toll/interleukin-1 receptor domain-containing protein [Mannheimia haemolytica]
MNKLTYIFKGDYINRVQEKIFINDVISSFSGDQVTGIGIKVNNNPWNLEVFTFVTIDTNYLQREEFLGWLSSNYKEKSINHNVFLKYLPTSGNIQTFIDSSSLIFFDNLFIWSECCAVFFNKCPEMLECILGKTRAEFEQDNPQYTSTESQKPIIFISHSSWDKEHIAVPICDYLCSTEIPIWLDRNEISLESSKNKKILYKKIYDGISQCETGIFIITENFFKSTWAKRELMICKRLNKKIILLVSKKIYEKLGDLKGCQIFYSSNMVEVDFSNQNYLDKISEYI